MTARPFDTHDKVDRPDYCGCELPWQTRTGPLKDGSHFSDCVATEVAEDVAILVRDRDRWRKRAEDRAPLVTIVRGLADINDPAMDYGSCTLCLGGVEFEMHAADCVWVLAREWVDAEG